MKRINPNACREGFRFFPAEKNAFTLVELLIVITIIGMLAAMSFVVTESAQQTARISSTKVTISKIDQAVTELYESFMYRRFDVDTKKLDQLGVFYSATDIAKIRLHYLRDTMRMEMPNNWHEALTPPIAYGGLAGAGLYAPDSALRKTFVRVFVQAGGIYTIDNNGLAVIDVKEGNNEKILTDEQAKLLYLIVMNSDPEMREMFGESGTADPQQVGIPCFIDAWGKPIYFLRWAPGFYGSERQPDIWKWTGSSPNKLDNVAEWNDKLSPDMLDDIVFENYYDKKESIDAIFQNPGDPKKYVFNTIIEMPDPMDPMRVRPSTNSNAKRSRPGWLLVPLVYSAGPDKGYAISIPRDGDDMVVLDPFAQGFGAPFGIGGENIDNIHNHTMGGR